LLCYNGKTNKAKQKKKKVTVAAFAFFVELHHCSSPFFLLWSCAAMQLLSRKKKVEL
jgi:hypothetical protein